MRSFSLFLGTIVGCAVLLFPFSTYGGTDLDSAKRETALFLGGNRAKFRSGGHPKSLGLDVEFQYPATWVKHEGVRPHIVVNVDSVDEFGPMCHLQIVRFSDALVQTGALTAEGARNVFATITPKEEKEIADELLAKSVQREAMNELSTKPISKFSHKWVTYDGWPGATVSARTSAERAGVVLETQTTFLYTLYREYLVGVCFALPRNPAESEKEFSKRCEAFDPLILGIGNSIVFQSQYQQSQPNTRKQDAKKALNDLLGIDGAVPQQQEPLTQKNSAEQPVDHRPSVPKTDVIVVKWQTADLYLCRQGESHLLVDFSDYPKGDLKVLPRGKRIQGVYLPKGEGRAQTEINGEVVSVPYLVWTKSGN